MAGGARPETAPVGLSVLVVEVWREWIARPEDSDRCPECWPPLLLLLWLLWLWPLLWLPDRCLDPWLDIGGGFMLVELVREFWGPDESRVCVETGDDKGEAAVA